MRAESERVIGYGSTRNGRRALRHCMAALAITASTISVAQPAIAAAAVSAVGVQQTSPQPVAEWIFALDNALPRAAGPAQSSVGEPQLKLGMAPQSLTFEKLRETDRRQLPVALSGKPFTVELWLLDHVNQPVAATLGRDAGKPGGWVLGYAAGEAVFGPVADSGKAALHAPVGDGFKGRWHHLVGLWDGARWKLYIDGAKAGEAVGSKGMPATELALAGFFENERFMHLPDLVKAAAVYDRALGEAEIVAAFNRRVSLVEEGRLTDKALHFTQSPYLNAPTTTSIELSWETDHPAAATVEWGRSAGALSKREFPKNAQRLGGITLDGLEADTPYFYRVTAVDDAGGKIESGLLSFRTAPLPGAPFTIAVSADTEARTHINSRMSALMWEERPNLLLLAGDLTDGGSRDKRFEWTHEYFAGMGPFFGRVPVTAAPGNGESEQHWFRHYHRQPGDEAFFNHRYGDVEIFVVDSNLEDREEREPGFRNRQKAWLDQALGASTAKWKIAIHHHALMSTDDDDYGDSWSGPSDAGDLELQAEVQRLYEKHHVDFVFVGHLHTYERSWPIKDGKVDLKDGVTYVQVGGLGGNLEDFQPNKPWFNRKTFRDHHYLMLRGAGDRIEAEVFDADGKLRDSFGKTKSK